MGLCSGGAVVRRWLGLRLRDGRRKRGSGSFCRAAGCLGVRVWRGGSPWISAGDRGGALRARGRCGRRRKATLTSGPGVSVAERAAWAARGDARSGPGRVRAGGGALGWLRRCALGRTERSRGGLGQRRRGRAGLG